MGQRKKAYIAFAMATNTRYLLMDEPTNGLDIPSKSQFRKVIARHMSEDRTVVISTHQVHDVEQMLDHIVMLDQRSVLLNASMQDIQDQYTFEYRTPQQMTEDRTVVISTHQVHDVEQMLDHIVMLDQRSVLLNASMQDIQDEYTFEYRSPQQMDDTVLYAEPTLQGNAVITKRQDGDAETQVNLELLFNFKTQSK